MRQDSAQLLALQALGWLATQDEAFAAFLSQSGIELATLRARAAEPAVLRSVLDHVQLSDAWVVDCAAALGVAPEEIGIARAVLGGGDRRHWT